jgi:hypothetical protein
LTQCEIGFSHGLTRFDAVLLRPLRGKRKFEMANRLWILGASDPEMTAIEATLRECGEFVVYATVDGQRVHPGNAYRASCDDARGFSGIVYEIECDVDVLRCSATEGIDSDATVVRFDHHRPGDPGYGVPPAEFLRGSSLGQVIAELARLRALRSYWDERHTMNTRVHGDVWLQGSFWVVRSGVYSYTIPASLVFAAAADHCLGAAYAGQCPGVDVDAFGDWRIATRAAHQGRSVDDVRADIDRATTLILDAAASSFSEDVEELYTIYDGQMTIEAMLSVHSDMRLVFADLRGEEIPELPEAACRLGVAYLATPKPGPDGRRKVVLQCATTEQLAAWPAWAAKNGIVDCYGGDPARGFAGGYLRQGASC